MRERANLDCHIRSVGVRIKDIELARSLGHHDRGASIGSEQRKVGRSADRNLRSNLVGSSVKNLYRVYRGEREVDPLAVWAGAQRAGRVSQRNTSDLTETRQVDHVNGR